ncbi:5112_t:CDS:2 [Ambispora gerdemannii]|uniref:5112_t:CDS:1 n=1 Tax=Ambispora gerdemannii TaxID=144530 RepID=A0A9N9CIJ6_9GLOM|nr:5112_t:CDS:2 [Ambispora gerdemannii]
MFVSHEIIILGFFTASVFSCSPNNFDGNFITISFAGANNWRINIAGGIVQQNAQIITYNSGNQPAPNEIFMIPQQPTRGVFELLPYISFYQDYVIGMPSVNAGDTFKLQTRDDSNAQKFTFDCNTCNIQTNSQNWTPYHTSCQIKNIGFGFCMIGGDYFTNVNQTYCTTASNWDLWGRISPYITNSTTSSNITNSTTSSNITNSTTSSNISDSTTPPKTPASSISSISSHSNMEETPGVQLSPGELVGIVVGSCAVTALIALLVYWFFRRRQKYTMDVDRVNVQVHG